MSGALSHEGEGTTTTVADIPTRSKDGHELCSLVALGADDVLVEGLRLLGG